MRSLFAKIIGSAVLGLAVLAAGVPAQAATVHAEDSVAYFVFTDITREEAVVKLTDPDKIAHARNLLSGESQDRPHLIGRIDKTTAYYNPRWSYHYRPETVDFFDHAIEVCDATIPYVEDHLDEAGGAFLPGLVWCPWSSKLVRELRM